MTRRCPVRLTIDDQREGRLDVHCERALHHDGHHIGNHGIDFPKTEYIWGTSL